MISIAVITLTLLTCILMDMLAGFFGFKEGWGFSQQSYLGIWKITGKENDHSIWKKERACLMISVFSFSIAAALIGFDLWLLWYLLAIGCAWAAKFSANHQYWYNWGMLKMGEEGYKIGIDESIHTTSNATSKRWKIFCFVSGWVIAILFITLWLTLKK